MNKWPFVFPEIAAAEDEETLDILAATWRAMLKNEADK